MTQHNRRDFLKTAAATGAGFWILGTGTGRSKSPSERIHFGCIGVGGKGESDTTDAARHGTVVALCDVDDTTLAAAGKRYPAAKRYNDFRKMLDEMGKTIDAVTVSTPDHCHAPASAMAMRMGKHCFTQKPLTRTLYEARRLAEIAREMKVATQMGNQGTASNPMRKWAAMIRAGAVGAVKEVHVWTDRPLWAQGIARPPASAAPKNLHWDLWLGPSPRRPYARGNHPYVSWNESVGDARHPKDPLPDGYHPFTWRGWWDFGTGALGDMACHIMNLPFMALDLRDPAAVEAESSGTNKDSFAKWSIIRYHFAASGDRPALSMTWYDGGKRPAAELLDGIAVQSSGCLIIGQKGKLYAPFQGGRGTRLLGGAAEVKADFPKSPGHWEEFVRAIKEGKPAMSNFPDYAGPLTETVLLGNLAVWAGKKVEWDARRLKATNAPEVEALVKPTYRKGYEL
jgi:predicted dehydrogenase